MQDGVVYKPQGNPSRDFTFLAPRSQDYLISMVAPVNTSFTLELIIPRPGPTPAANFTANGTANGARAAGTD